MILSRKARSSISACPKLAPKRSPALQRSRLSPRYKANIHCGSAMSKAIYCRCAGHMVSASSHTHRSVAGFLTGQVKSIDDLPENDWRRNDPRFSKENFRGQYGPSSMWLARLQRSMASPTHRSRLRGCSRRAMISFPFPAPTPRDDAG